MKQGFIKVAAVTPDLRVADVAYNTEKICEAIEEAAQEKGNPLSCAVFASSLRGRGADVHGVFSYCGF